MRLDYPGWGGRAGCETILESDYPRYHFHVICAMVAALNGKQKGPPGPKYL